jgi:hypothetical protein
MPFQVSVGRFYVAHWDNLVSVRAKSNVEMNVERVCRYQPISLS